MAPRRASPAPKLVSLIVWLAVCLAVSLTFACARPGDVHRTEAAADSSSSEQKLPFHQSPDHATDDSARPAVPPDRKSGSGTPFPAASHPRSLLAGTLITVRLDNSLSISKVRPGDAFTASLAGPLAVDGETLIERGTPVSGRVESAQPSVDRPGMSPDPGYLRLILNSMTVDGKALNLQTSSLFAKGTFQSSGLSSAYSSVPVRSGGSDLRFRDLQVQKGRRLTFRLTAPVTFADPNAVADRRFSHTPTE
jgi:hypothetical protein